MRICSYMGVALSNSACLMWGKHCCYVLVRSNNDIWMFWMFLDLVILCLLSWSHHTFKSISTAEYPTKGAYERKSLPLAPILSKLRQTRKGSPLNNSNKIGSLYTLICSRLVIQFFLILTLKLQLLNKHQCLFE